MTTLETSPPPPPGRTEPEASGRSCGSHTGPLRRIDHFATDHESAGTLVDADSDSWHRFSSRVIHRAHTRRT